MDTSFSNKEGTDIPEGTIIKVIKRNGLRRKKRKRVKRSRASSSYDMQPLFPFHEVQADLKEIRDKETLPKEVHIYLEGIRSTYFPVDNY